MAISKHKDGVISVPDTGYDEILAAFDQFIKLVT